VIGAARLGKVVGGRTVLEDVTFSVVKGECVGVADSRDRSHTTLLRILATLTPPTGGILRIGDIDAISDPLRARNHVAYAGPEIWASPGLSVHELLWLAAQTRGSSVDRGRDIAKQLALDLDCPVYRLPPESHGTVALALALASSSAVMLLHASCGVRTSSRDASIRLIREAADGGAAVVVGSNDRSELAGMCDRVFELESGRLHGESRPQQ
jgi:ABC-type multidrug transport system ATPase subunit